MRQDHSEARYDDLVCSCADPCIAPERSCPAFDLTDEIATSTAAPASTAAARPWMLADHRSPVDPGERRTLRQVAESRSRRDASPMDKREGHAEVSDEIEEATRLVRVDRPKPTHEEYFMALAMQVRTRADCIGRRVGAILVYDNRIISTGYNGVPEGMTNCTQGGCERCANRGGAFPSGTAYDICICVHAEQNCLMAAARHGIAVRGGSIYTTMQPCFGCAKEMLQAKVSSVFYLHPWAPPPELRDQYDAILQAIPEGIHQFDIDDWDIAWAHPPSATPPPIDNGHPALDSRAID